MMTMTPVPTASRPADADDAAQLLAARLATDESRDVAAAVRDIVRHTPLLSPGSLSQRSHPARGGEPAAHRLVQAARGAGQAPRSRRPRAVVAGSAGNHGQSPAYAARARSVPCEVFMPRDAPVSKVAAVEGFGGVVHLRGVSVDECIAAARARADELGGAFVHPFDDPDVILGQATLGLELLDDVPDLARVVVPVGGGGLITLVADTGANVRSVEHVREAVALRVGQSGVELVLETRGADHARQILEALAAAGYDTEELPALPPEPAPHAAG
jgi:threonine dehydratase